MLVIGADEVFLPALRLALTRHRVHVETAPMDQAVEAAVVAAPDLILLAGEAAKHSGHELLSKLTSSPISSVIPIALLGDDGALDARLDAFRHGAAAVIPRTASIDAVAEAIARLARDIPDRGGEALGEIGEATLEEFVGALTRELRSGILTVMPGEELTPVRLVLGGGRPLAAFIDEFVARVRSHVVQAEPLRYEFDDRAGGTVQILPSETPASEPPPGNISGLRLLLADDDPARADIVAQELRSRGAEVVVSALNPSDLELSRLRALDPEVLIVGEREIEGQAYSLLRRMKRDTRLRWASLLVVRWEASRDPAQLVPTVERLTAPLAGLAEADRGLCDRAELGDGFDARLEVNGPARCLRALAASSRALRVTIQNPRLRLELDISDKLLVGATATGPNGERWEGAQALAALLVISSGRIHVEPSTQPSTTNLMAPVGDALDLAEHEAAPIAPSLPAQAGPSEPPGKGPAIPSAPGIPRESLVQAVAQPLPSADTVRGHAVAVTASASPAAASWARGIKGPIVAAFVLLAVVQGLVFAGFFRWLRERGTTPSTASSAAPSSAAAPSTVTPPAFAAPSVAKAERTVAVPAASGAALPPSAPPAPAGSADTDATEDVAAKLADESGSKAPTCDELFGATSPNVGDYPGAAYEQLRLARKALVAGRADDAQRGYCTAIRWDGKNPIYYFELAQLLLVRRDGAASAAYARDGVRLEPTSTKGQSIIGDGLARIGDIDGARSAWYAANNVNNPSVDEIAVLTTRSLSEAEQAMNAHDFARAERFYRRAAILDDASAPARRGLANALLRLGDSANGLRWAKAAAALLPKDPLVQTTLGEALFASGDKEGARAAWTEAELLGYPDAKRRLERLAK